MASTFDPSPFCWLEFDQDGALVDPGAAAALQQAIKTGATDLVVLSHGWKNDQADATRLYGTLWGNVRPRLKRDPAKVVVAGVLWPAKQYGPDIDDSAAGANGGGTLSLGNAVGHLDLPQTEFDARVAEAAALLGAPGLIALAAKAAADNYGNAPEFFNTADGWLTSQVGTELEAERGKLLPNRATAGLILQGLQAPPVMPAAPGAAKALSLISGVQGAWMGARAAVARVLNQFTYYEMKARAGVVGAKLGKLLAELDLPKDFRLHLVGHSFGARLVTATADGFARNAVDGQVVQSITLLQGAFSHNALAKATPGLPTGAFANVVGKVRGPISITHTHNDRATTFWYALASRLSRDNTTALGDASDQFGAMGANGAQNVVASMVTEFGAEIDHGFLPVVGKINNFAADHYVVAIAGTDAHNNVATPACGELVAATINATPP